MNASQTARSLNVPAVVTAVVAAWFVLASGAAFADAGQAAGAAAPAQVTLTPKGAMKITVVAARPATQVALTPEGTMKLTVVGQRTQPAHVQAASDREASRS